jgi:SAM-dependent methyltransferase
VPRNWDEHYSNSANFDFLPEPILVHAVEYLRPGHALDLACGPGRNALYLASLGWQVTAVDSSSVAIGILCERSAGLSVDARVADLEAANFPIASDSYDLVCDFFYLQRDLFPRIRGCVRAGGMFAGAIHLFEANGDTGERKRNPAFLLHDGELRREFADWKILFYSEGAKPGRSRRTARILARKA